MKKTPLVYARELHAKLSVADTSDRVLLIRGFLASLSRERKSGLRPRILAAFSYLALAAEGRRAGRIVTVAKLDETTRHKIEKQFKNVVFEEQIDRALIGGAIIEVEDARIDGSIRTQIKSLKRVLAQE
jgi:F0F1-type ATP synthase delta subunit